MLPANRCKLALLSLLILGAAPSLSARAADETYGSSSATAPQSGKPSVLDNVRLSYWGMLAGSTLSMKGYSPNSQGDVAAPIGIWNQVVLGYKVSPNTQIDMQTIFDWKMSGGHQLTLLNPRVGVSGSVYSGGNISVWANVNAELPTSESAKANGLITSVGGFQEVVYSVPKTRLNAIFWNWTRFFSYNNGTAGQVIAGSVMPTLRYDLSPKFKPVFTVEVPYTLARASSGKGFTTDPMMLRPGFSWDVTSKINIMPYMVIFPTGKMTADATSFGMWLSGTVL